MAVRVNLHESACCKAPLKTVNAGGGHYYLKCSRCGKQPGDPLPAPPTKQETPYRKK